MALTSNLTSFVPGRSAYTFALTSLLAVRVIYLRGVRRKHALPEGWVRATKAEKREARAALRQAKRAEKRQRTKERKRLRAKKMAKKSIAVQDILKETLGADEFRRRRREEKALQKARVQNCLRDGAKVVFDLSFTNTMCHKELCSLAAQLARCWGAIKENQKPMSMHITSVNDTCREYLENTNYDKWNVGRYEEPFEDIFDHSKLVMLSPEATDVLTTFEPDDIYVIGGIVDRTQTAGMALQRAQELGIRTKRIDVRAVNKKRSIVLNLDHVVNILLDLQSGTDIVDSLKVRVPLRHHSSSSEQLQKKRREAKKRHAMGYRSAKPRIEEEEAKKGGQGPLAKTLSVCGALILATCFASTRR